MATIDDLSEAAQVAYQAYLDMRDSKHAHYDYLQAIENKYQSGGVPGPDETRRLERLLADHDRNVLAFTTAMAEVNDSDEMASLVRLMS